MILTPLHGWRIIQLLMRYSLANPSVTMNSSAMNVLPHEPRMLVLNSTQVRLKCICIFSNIFVTDN